MATPRMYQDPDPDRKQALKRAARAAGRAQEAERARSAAILSASECGASLRELAEATGISRMTVRRILARAPIID